MGRPPPTGPVISLCANSADGTGPGSDEDDENDEACSAACWTAVDRQRKAPGRIAARPRTAKGSYHPRSPPRSGGSEPHPQPASRHWTA
jgi:hypothetical protein